MAFLPGPLIPRVKNHIIYDVLSVAITVIFAGFFVQNQHRKYRGWRKWPLSEQLATFFIGTALGILIVWITLSTRERLQLIEFLHDLERGKIPPGAIPPTLNVGGKKMKYIIGYGYFVGVWLIKAAFLAGYWRLRGTLHRPIRLLLYAATVYTILTFLANVLLHTFSCGRPISVNWEGGTELHCFPYAVLPNLTVLAVTNISADLLILLIPLLILRTFKLRRHERYSLAFVFVVGIMSIVAMALRYGFAWRDTGTGDLRDWIEEDEWRKVFVTLEATCAVCAFCMPAMRRVVRSFIARRKQGSEARKVREARDRGNRRLEESNGTVTEDSGLGMTEMMDSEEREGKLNKAIVNANEEGQT